MILQAHLLPGLLYSTVLGENIVYDFITPECQSTGGQPPKPLHSEPGLWGSGYPFGINDKNLLFVLREAKTIPASCSQWNSQEVVVTR